MQPLWLPTHYELILAFFKQSLNVKFWWAPKGARGRGKENLDGDRGASGAGVTNKGGRKWDLGG